MSFDQLHRADEVFKSSADGGAIAFSRLDGVVTGRRAAGDLGPVTPKLQAAYPAPHDDVRLIGMVRGFEPPAHAAPIHDSCGMKTPCRPSS